MRRLGKKTSDSNLAQTQENHCFTKFLYKGIKEGLPLGSYFFRNKRVKCVEVSVDYDGNFSGFICPDRGKFEVDGNSDIKILCGQHLFSMHWEDHGVVVDADSDNKNAMLYLRKSDCIEAISSEDRDKSLGQIWPEGTYYVKSSNGICFSIKIAGDGTLVDLDCPGGEQRFIRDANDNIHFVCGSDVYSYRAFRDAFALKPTPHFEKPGPSTPYWYNEVDCLQTVTPSEKLKLRDAEREQREKKVGIEKVRSVKSCCDCLRAEESRRISRTLFRSIRRIDLEKCEVDLLTSYSMEAR